MERHGGNVYGKDIELDFSANINPLKMPQKVMEAAIKGVCEAYKYPDINYEKLRYELGKYENINFENIVCTNGASEFIYSVVNAVKPKKAVMFAPTFSEYENALRTINCKIEYFKIYEEDDFKVNVEKLIEKLDITMDMLFICNPNNPTGEVIEPKDLNLILKHCEQNNIYLVVDECFNNFLQDAEKYSIKDCIYDNEKLIIIKAFTKMYAMAGLRLGYGMCSAELAKEIKNVLPPWSVSVPAEYAAIEAMKERNFVCESCDLIEREKTYLINELGKLGLKIYGSKANYIFFKCEKNLDLYELFKEKKILIRDCSNYKGLQKGFYRIAVKTHEENKRFIEAGAKILWQK